MKVYRLMPARSLRAGATASAMVATTLRKASFVDMIRTAVVHARVRQFDFNNVNSLEWVSVSTFVSTASLCMNHTRAHRVLASAKQARAHTCPSERRPDRVKVCVCVCIVCGVSLLCGMLFIQTTLKTPPSTGRIPPRRKGPQ